MNRLLRRLLGFSGEEPPLQAPLASPAPVSGLIPAPPPPASPLPTTDSASAAPISPGLTYDVFLSYSHDDWEEAKLLEADLQSAGLSVWRDPRMHAVPDPNQTATIQEARERSARVLVLWSDDSVKSSWVLEEAQEARRNGKLVSLALRPLESLRLPAGLRALPTVGLAQIREDPNLLLRALGAAENPAQPGRFALVTPALVLQHLPPVLTPALHGRDGELRELTGAWDRLAANVMAFHAPGGAGKTALLSHFLQGFQSSGWRGASAVFAWSFHTRGSPWEGRGCSAPFFDAAFAFFASGPSASWVRRQEEARSLGLEEPVWPPRAERDKGIELAHHLQTRRVLLLLDGLDALQRGAHGPEAGRLLDPALQALLESLAARNDGLCVVTSRWELTGLATHPGWQSRFLPPLDPVSGMQLLRELGVEPQYPSSEFLLWKQSGGEAEKPATPGLAPTRSGTWHLPAYRSFADRLPEEIEARHLPLNYNFPKDLESGLLAVDRTLGEPLPVALAFKLLHTVSSLEGHALSLTLLAQFLRGYHHGSIEAAREAPLLDIYQGEERGPHSLLRATEFALARQLADPIRNRNQPPAETEAGRRLALLLFLSFFEGAVPMSLFPVVFSLQDMEFDPALDPPIDLTGLEPVYRKQDRQSGSWESEEVWQGRALRQETERRALFRSLFSWSAGYSSRSLTRALDQLAALGLVHKAQPDAPWEETGIDCPPLVRSYFARRLQALDPGLAATVHGRLFDHFRFAGLPEEFQEPVAYGTLAYHCSFPDRDLRERLDDVIAGRRTSENSPSLPPAWFTATSAQLQNAVALLDQPLFATALQQFRPATVAGLEPLQAAVAHGCQAGRFDESFNEVYWPRVARGGEDCATALGWRGPDLGTLAWFFKEPFQQPSPHLSPADQALILNKAAQHLRALDRPSDAVPALERAEALSAARGDDLRDTAVASGNLSEALLALGRLEDEDGQEGALTVAARAVALADQSGDLFLRMVTRASNLGAALLARGRLRQAEDCFQEAERLEQEWQPSLPRLYSTAGYLYGDLLLARRRTAEVEQRAAEALGCWERFQGGAALDRFLAQLLQLQARGQQGIHSQEASALLTALSLCGDEETQARALVAAARGELRLLEQNPGERQRRGTRIAEWLDQAEIICQRACLPLLLADAHLLAARTALVLGGHQEVAWEHRNDAATLIQRHSYGRRDPDLAVLSAEMARTLETFETACAWVGGEGWWHLLPRLELLAGELPGAPAMLAPLQQAEAAYQAGRDALQARLG